MGKLDHYKRSWERLLCGGDRGMAGSLQEIMGETATWWSLWVVQLPSDGLHHPLLKLTRHFIS